MSLSIRETKWVRYRNEVLLKLAGLDADLGDIG